MTPPARGRPVDPQAPGADSREALLTAARQLFAEHGYERTTMRAIAARAAVDPALIYHYFPGGKRALLAATLTLPPQVTEMLAGIGSPPERIGEEVVRRALWVWDEHADVREQGVALIRIAVAHEAAGDLLRTTLRGFVLGMVGDLMRDDDRELRAGLVLAQIQGMLLHRYVLHIPPLSTARPEELVETMGPVIQHYVTGELRRSATPAG